MATQPSFSANCGAALTTPVGAFCASCGHAVVAPSSTPQPAAPPTYTPPPATAPADWSAPPAGPPAYSPGAPFAPARTSPSPAALVVGAVIVVVIAAVGYFAFLSHGSPGSITINPSTYSCSSSQQIAATIKLPASVKDTDQITIQLDGRVLGTVPVSAVADKQADGSWLKTTTQTGTESCNDATGGKLSSGKHTMRLMDSKGSLLAEGSYTLTP